MENDWKKRLGVVYSTNPDFSFDQEQGEVTETPDPSKQNLYVSLDKKNRKGKSVTVIRGFIGSDEDLKSLGKTLKSRCGVGGTIKEGEILIQGDFREKIMDMLSRDGYRVKRAGG